MKKMNNWILMAVLIVSGFIIIPSSSIVQALNVVYSTGFEDGTLSQQYSNTWITTKNAGGSNAYVTSSPVRSGSKSYLWAFGASDNVWWNLSFTESFITKFSFYVKYSFNEISAGTPTIDFINSSSGTIIIQLTFATSSNNLRCVIHPFGGSPTTLQDVAWGSWQFIGWNMTSNDSCWYGKNDGTWLESSPTNIEDRPLIDSIHFTSPSCGVYQFNFDDISVTHSSSYPDNTGSYRYYLVPTYSIDDWEEYANGYYMDWYPEDYTGPKYTDTYLVASVILDGVPIHMEQLYSETWPEFFQWLAFNSSTLYEGVHNVTLYSSRGLPYGRIDGKDVSFKETYAVYMAPEYSGYIFLREYTDPTGNITPDLPEWQDYFGKTTFVEFWPYKQYTIDDNPYIIYNVNIADFENDSILHYRIYKGENIVYVGAYSLDNDHDAWCFEEEDYKFSGEGVYYLKAYSLSTTGTWIERYTSRSINVKIVIEPEIPGESPPFFETSLGTPLGVIVCLAIGLILFYFTGSSLLFLTGTSVMAFTLSSPVLGSFQMLDTSVGVGLIVVMVIVAVLLWLTR